MGRVAHIDLLRHEPYALSPTAESHSPTPQMTPIANVWLCVVVWLCVCLCLSLSLSLTHTHILSHAPGHGGRRKRCCPGPCRTPRCSQAAARPRISDGNSAERERQNFKGLKGFGLKNGSSQGQNLAWTVSFAPNSMFSGRSPSPQTGLHFCER